MSRGLGTFQIGKPIAVLLLSSAALTGCVSSTLDTPPGFVPTLEQPTAADVLSLNETGGLPTPSERPLSTDVITQTDVSQAGSEALEPPPPATQLAATAPASPIVESNDIASARIASAQNAPLANGASATVAAATPPPAPVTTQAKPQATGLLAALFGGSNRKPPAPVGAEPRRTAAKPVAASAATTTASAGALPGVDKQRALGVNSGSASEDRPIVQVASAAGLARLTPNGIKTQHAGVDVKCFKPALVRVLKTVERKFGKPVVVTSGYRSPARNKRARGAKNSLHIYCAAADIQVQGVSKWTLAKYLRSMPGRGGVGTYCHTNSVHVDIGPKRDWNWRCRRKK